MSAINLGVWIVLGLGVLVVHLAAIVLVKALRTYSRSRLEAVCEARGRPERADLIAHHDERTERSAEALATLTGFGLVAVLGGMVLQAAARPDIMILFLLALAVGALGHILAGVVGRVHAESVLDRAWPAMELVRRLTAPVMLLVRLCEVIAYRRARPANAVPRPASVEVEIPASAGHPEESEPDLPEPVRDMLEHVVELSRRDVSEVMTPSAAILALPATVSAEAAASAFRQSGRSRIPLFGENRDDILGILFAKDLYARMTDPDGPRPVVPRTLVRPPLCVPETKNAIELLDEFCTQRTQIAIVLDEYGSVAGLVTMEDLLEQVVGPIDDEHDVPTARDTIVPLGGARYEVNASLSIEQLNERLSLHLPTDQDYVTIGGFAFHKLGRLPEPGDSFRHDGVEFTIVEITDHTIRRLQLDLQPQPVPSGP